MFDHDRSATRGEMTTRGLYFFEHENKLGKAPAHSLFERIKINLKKEGTIARDFNDYQVEINDTGLPSGIELQRVVG